MRTRLPKRLIKPGSAVNLDRLIQEAMRDRRTESVLFRTLLNATVYAHAPLSDDQPRLRLIQFTRPDGLMVLPCFTDMAKAQRAAQGAARVVALTGRQLMEITLGATLMINPNDHHCTLYPEEIRALLATGEVAIIDQVDVNECEAWIGVHETPPPWLMEALVAVFCSLSIVHCAYLVELRPQQQLKATLLIVVEVPSPHLERVARATITAIQAQCRQANLEIDLTGFDPAEGAPTWLVETGTTPFYRHVTEAVGARPRPSY